MKVLLIQQKFNKDLYNYNPDDKCTWNYLMPMGLPYLSAVLKQRGHEVTCLNLNHIARSETDAITSTFRNQRFNAVLLGGLSLFYPHLRDYIRVIRKADPSCKIIVGGGIIAAQPSLMFDLLKPDFTVIGEGEQTVSELIKYLYEPDMWQNIDGIGYRKDGIYCQTRDRKPIMDLDTLPFPDYDSFGFNDYLEHLTPLTYNGLDKEDHPRFYPILASRNCLFNCTFCFHPTGKVHRRRSVESIMQEIKEVVPKYKINIIIFYDEMITPDKKITLELCRQIKEFAATLPWSLHWIGNVRVNSVDEETIKAMSESGCHMVSLGLESYSQQVLTSMNKRITPTEIEHALEVLAKYNIASQGTFIFGDPAETLETARTTLGFYKNNQDIIRGGVGLGFIIPFQGSQLYHYCVKAGIIPDETNFMESRAAFGYDHTKPMNLTGMSDGDFTEMRDMVLAANHTTRPSVTGRISGGAVETTCPYCGKKSRYIGIKKPLAFLGISLGCRHCNGRFDLVSQWHPVKKFMLDNFSYSTLLNIKNLVRK